MDYHKDVDNHYQSLVIENSLICYLSMKIRNHHVIDSMALIHLPNGPTAYFRLTNVKLSHEIYGHGRSSNHKPELILNNFNTRLVHTISRWFQAYFIMCHNFKEDRLLHFTIKGILYFLDITDKVELQEIGTRFTLKLKWLQKGTFNKNNEYE
nr:2025_t:CDS:2 [Entrophospora candida]